MIDITARKQRMRTMLRHARELGRWAIRPNWSRPCSPTAGIQKPRKVLAHGDCYRSGKRRRPDARQLGSAYPSEKICNWVKIKNSTFDRRLRPAIDARVTARHASIQLS